MPAKVIVFLSVAFASVAALEFRAQQECPEECDCHYFRVNYVTDCSESNLTEIPYQEISPNVYILDMNGNDILNIETFPENMKIHRLQLAENKLSELTVDMFAGLRYMVDVDLSSNNISMIDPDSFRDSHGLISVELQNNPLMNVAAGPFLKCRSLQYLDISRCGLSKLSVDFFSETPLLTYLDLSGNPLGTIQTSVLEPLVTLSELMLSCCNLTSLQPHFLQRQTHLKLLDLSGNHLTTVDWTPIFAHLPRLENLNLRNIRINNLPENLFANNTFLRILTLSDNELDDLDIKTTLGENLKSLHSLDLSNCRLSGPLDEKTFANATMLKNLNLSGNRLSSRDLSVALSPLTRLTTLSLKDCSLSKLPNNTFENLVHLKQLDISWNSLNNVFDDLLGSLKDLEYLNMGYSNLSTLSRDTFSKTTNLKRLILSGNELRELEMGLFKNLEALETLEIENCGLEKSIDETVFCKKTYRHLRELKMAGNPLKIQDGPMFPEQLSQLRLLDMSNCNLTYLPNDCFKNTRNLTRLHLGNNMFTSDHFSNASFLDVLTNLEYLDLSGNRFARLSINLIETTQVRDINLTNNSWICDCALADWWNWAIDKGDISHLIGSTLTPQEVFTKGTKRKKALLCRIHDKTTPPRTKSPRKRKSKPEMATKTWARYLKESHCPIKKINAELKSNVSIDYSKETPHLPPLPESALANSDGDTAARSYYVLPVSFGLLAFLATFALAYLACFRRRRLLRTRTFAS